MVIVKPGSAILRTVLLRGTNMGIKGFIAMVLTGLIGVFGLSLVFNVSSLTVTLGFALGVLGCIMCDLVEEV